MLAIKEILLLIVMDNFLSNAKHHNFHNLFIIKHSNIV